MQGNLVVKLGPLVDFIDKHRSDSFVSPQTHTHTQEKIFICTQFSMT
jgi:hypothetical protein